jgi:hypothetical protein
MTDNESNEYEIDFSDIDDFIEAADAFKETKAGRVRALRDLEDALEKEEDEKVKPGTPTQYAIYGAGYMPTTQTIKSLESGCYDIRADQNGVFVVPTPKPTGILLELPEMRSEEVIKTVERFWDSEKDYKEGNDFVMGGAAFKAGVMIYGPPGTGKSCTIKIVSDKLVKKGGTVFFGHTHPNIIMSFLGDFAKIEPNRKSIVILEDIDSLVNNYGEAGFLEMLDSAKTVDNVLFIATTNYPERLDPRIYNRPGRFSHVIKIGLPGEEARKAYLKAILKDHRDVEEIVTNTDGFTIDHLTALINAVYREKKSLKTEIARLKKLFTVKPSSDEGKRNVGFGWE